MEGGRREVGQGLIVQEGRALCVEAFKGTNECIAEGGYRAFSPVLCKVTKPGHDMRFDVPCIGIGTIRHCAQANIRAIAIEANRTIMLQADAVRALCAEHGIALFALPVPEFALADEGVPPVEDDAAHAHFIAEALERMGIGHGAVVCDGVIIAVEDVEGPEKCLRRAGRYMKRLRFARLANWLCRVLLQRGGAPPKPMFFASTQPLTDSVRRAAKKAGVVV